MRAIVFPGQGAQHPGMAREIVEAVPEARALLSRADEVLDRALSTWILEGPANVLEATDVCQPAIFVTSAAVVRALEVKKGLRREDFAATAGLSLGEYTALWFAGSLEFDDALRLVALRGQAMQAASVANPSGMASLLGASREQAIELSRIGSQRGVLVAANFLGPGNVAISGSLDALDHAEAQAKDLGIRRAVRLKVAGAFHSPLMASATTALREALARIAIAPPAIPFATNVTGDFVSDPERIREHLAEQVTSPVLWEDTMNAFCRIGIDEFVEPAPGAVLTGLLKKSAPQARLQSITTLAQLESYA
jgi:[acyl-carrier-protein] S-malonyltransferase